MKKVYILTAGKYSDYRIIEVFSTIQKAKDFIHAVPEEDYNEVEEYMIDPPTVTLINRGYRLWNVWMLRDGTVKYISTEDVTTSKVGYFISSVGPDRQQNRLCSIVWAKTEEQAIKITNERRISIIISGEDFK